jgi:signal transduction histidine kinase
MSDFLPATHLAALLGGLVAGVSLHHRVARRRLNEAAHELRRPLQALALAPADDCRQAWMAQAVAALGDLDARINGDPARGRRELVALTSILADARRRWAPLAEVDFEEAFVDRHFRGGVLRGDRQRVGAALDNLIVNALEYGSGPVRVEAGSSSDRVTLEVVNGQADRDPARSAPDPRRGHGLRAGERIASDHGGRLLAPRPEPGARRVRAALELPTVDG